MLKTANEIVIGFRMKADEANPFLINAIGTNSNIRVINSDRHSLKMRLMKLGDDFKYEHYFDLAISNVSNELCNLHFTVVNPEDTQKLAKMAQATLWIISEYGYKIKAFWSNDFLVLNKVTDTEVQNIMIF